VNKKAEQRMIADHATRCKTRLAELDRFWGKEQTKADVEVFILDHVFSALSTPPFTPEEKKLVADGVYTHVWQQAAKSQFASAT
jgi:type I restriction enzyme R subunit